MATKLPQSFAPWHRWDRNFFLAFVAACWLGAIIGFYPAVSARFTGKADYVASPVLQVHAILFPAWLGILTVQVLLIRIRRTAWHKRLGIAAACLVPVMIVTGIWAEILSQRFYSPRDPLNQSFFIIPLFYMAAFGMLTGLALWRRADGPAHKRWMLLANAVIVGAAYARWWGLPIMSVTGNGFFGMIANTFAGFYLLVGAACLYDWITRRQLHPVYQTGIPALLLCHLGVSAIYHAEGWRPIARAIAGI